jgi:hypothetical protein
MARPETIGKDVAVAALNEQASNGPLALQRTEFRASVRRVTMQSGHKSVVLDVHHEDIDAVVPLDKALGNLHVIIQRLPADQRLPLNGDQKQYAPADPLPTDEAGMAALERDVQAAAWREAQNILRTGTEAQKLRIITGIKGLGAGAPPPEEADDDVLARLRQSHVRLMHAMTGRDPVAHDDCPTCTCVPWAVPVNTESNGDDAA